MWCSYPRMSELASLLELSCSGEDLLFEGFLYFSVPEETWAFCFYTVSYCLSWLPLSRINTLSIMLPVLCSDFFYVHWICLERRKSESCSVVSDSLWPHGLFSPWNSPDKTNGVGSLSLLQGIFPTLESNPDLLHCRQSFYQLSHKGSPRILEWIPILSPADFPNPGV